MILISYDIKDDKLRTKFSKFILRFGHRIQYSVYEIDNSDRILNNIICDIENTFLSEFSEADSVMILKLSNTCKVVKMGFPEHEDLDLMLV
jgi:CRISPR-associated protein Cas2